MLKILVSIKVSLVNLVLQVPMTIGLDAVGEAVVEGVGRFRLKAQARVL